MTEEEEEKEKGRQEIRKLNEEIRAKRAASPYKIATEHGELCEECGIGWIRNRSCSNADCPKHDPEKEKRRPSPFDNLRYCETCHHNYYGQEDFDAHLPCSG